MTPNTIKPSGQAKRRILQNIWGNWSGYDGNRKVIEFGTDGQEAELWLNDPARFHREKQEARDASTIKRIAVESFRCDQCEAAMIQGVFCHEIGCPNTHKRFRDGEWVRVFECRECGCEVVDGESCCVY